MQNEFPWFVKLSLNLSSMATCGGTVLSNEFVLTAAHCLEDVTDLKSQVKLHFGSHIFEGSVIKVPIETFIHDCYTRIDKGFDIALVKVSPVAFSENIQPICLPLWKKSYANQNLTGIENHLILRIH